MSKINYLYMNIIFDYYKTMKIFLNNEEKEIKNMLTVSNFIKSFGEDKFFVVELNNEILTKDKHAKTYLQNDDKLEICEITGGG